MEAMLELAAHAVVYALAVFAGSVAGMLCFDRD